MNVQILKGISKVLAMTLVKFKDEKSQELVRDFIAEMCRRHSDASLESLNTVFKALCTKELINAPPAKAAIAALSALLWTTTIASYCNRKSTGFSLLIEYQSILYTLSLQTSNRNILDKAYECLKDFWKSDDEFLQVYFKKFSNMEPNHNSFMMLVALLRFHLEEKSDELYFSANRSIYLNHFIKGLITVKTKLNCHLYIASRIFLNLLSEDEAKSNILPDIQRWMLRNPETILEGVQFILQGFNFEINDNGLEISKILIQNLHSKNDENRICSMNAIKELAQKTSNPNCIETMLAKIFSILNGTEGKITVAEYRISLLQGAGNLSINKMEDDQKSKIMPSVSDNFIKILDAEIQEKVLTHGLEMFGLWSMSFKGELDSKIVKWFKKGLEHKSQAVKVSFLQWFLNCLHQGTLSSAANDFKGELIKIVEKSSQNVNQNHILCEGLAAACIILTITPKKDDSISSFWNIMLDMKKEIFTSDKFIGSLGSESLCNIVILSEKLLINFFEELKGPSTLLFKCILQAATSNILKVHLRGILAVEKLIFSPNGTKFAIIFLTELTKMMEKTKIISENDEKTLSDENDRTISATNIINIILTICTSLSRSPQDIPSILNHAILACSDQAVYSLNSELFEHLLISNGLDGKSFMTENWKNIQELILNDYKCNSMHKNAITIVTKLQPDIVNLVIENIIKLLSEITSISISDDDYFTYLTPEGQLYDKSVLPTNEEEKTSQIRRENKAYSYKEQLEEIQLRKELEQKKGKCKEIQMTPKQKEAVKNQLEKESALRAKIKEINDKLDMGISQIEACLAGSELHLSLHYKDLLPVILDGLRSPLLALPMSQLYLNLGSQQMDKGKVITISTIRLLKPKCSLPDEWTKIKLETTVSEIIAEKLKNNEDVEDNDEYLFNAPTFSFIFQFLRNTLTTDFISTDDLLAGIEIIAKHARMSGKNNDDKIDVYHPKFLPTLSMIKLLHYFISTCDGPIQAQAMAAFLDVAESISGNPNKAEATRDEIKFILSMLESSKEIVRDCAIRALSKMMNVLPDIEVDNELGMLVIRRLWISKHDISADIGELSDILWTNLGFEIPSILNEDLLKDIIHDESCVQKAAACSLVSLLKENQEGVSAVLNHLLEIYMEKLILVPAVLDQFNREIVPPVDLWLPRRGVAVTISQIAQFFDLPTVEMIIQFMVSTGLRDREEIVHKEMLAASLAVVDLHGKECVATLLPVFEDFLDKAPNNSDYDNIRHAVVILMGSLARHLDKDDKRIEPIVNRLLSALSTPSQQVQEAVANCLPHLIPSMKDQAPAIVKKLMNQLVKSDKYGEIIEYCYKHIV